MALDRISVVGIRPQASLEDSIRPKGNHLRWMFPPYLGFPDQGFQIFRRQAGDVKINRRVDFSQVSRMTPGQILDGVKFTYPSTIQINISRSVQGGAFLSINSPNRYTLKLSFSQPVSRVLLEIGGVTGSITVRAFSGAFVSAEVRSGSRLASSGSELWNIAAPGITHIQFEMLFKELRSVSYLHEDDDCNSPNWRLVAERPLLRTGDIEAALLRLNDPSAAQPTPLLSDLRNRYATNINEARQKYRTDLEKLIEWVNLLQNPNASVFLNPGKSPDKLLLPSENDNGEEPNPLQEIRPQSVLLLAALDPNIARILGLYWVDRESGESGGRYDYKVTGKWIKAQVGCGLAFNVGAQVADYPEILAPLTGKQLPGIRWNSDSNKAYGQVGLEWPSPRVQQGPVRPVLFDLYRRDSTENQRKFLTQEKPILVSPQRETKLGGSTCNFIDRNIPLGDYFYELVGIDLFGQLSKPISLDFVSVKDTQAPPPPLRLRASLRQPGYPWRAEEQLEMLERTNGQAKLELHFEFGELQRQQAPDAQSFQLYWRPDNLFESIEVTAKADRNLTGIGEEFEHRVSITGISPSELEKFKYGFITNVLDREQTLPVDQRRRFKIFDTLNNRLNLRLKNNTEFSEGTYKLISEPHHPETWNHITQENLAEIPVRSHVAGKLLRFGMQFNARVLEAIPLRQAANPVSAFPSGVVPADVLKNESEDLQIKTEIVLDVALAEADFLVGGKVQTPGAEYRILYASGGSLSEEDDRVVTRVRLLDSVDLRPNQSCTVLPAPPFQAKIMRVQEDTKGAFIIDTDAVPSIFNLTNLIEGAITDLPAQQKSFSILGVEAVSNRLRLRVRPLIAADSLPGAGSNILIIPPQFCEFVIQEDNSIPDYVRNVLGGEIAFDENLSDEEKKTHVLRALSGIYAAGGGQFSILVRLPEQINETVDLLTPNKPLRYHAPYRFQLDVDVAQRSGTSLDLVIPPEEGTRRAYFAVLTKDTAGNSSPLTVPVQVTAVKPPPTGKPGRPYPCGLNEESEAGYATPPDRQGRATLCVAWKTGDLTPADGLRYEVARALDNSVVATDRQNWLLGKSVPGLPPVQVQVVSVQPQPDGVLEVVAQRASTESDYALAAFDKGLLHQGGQNFRVQTAPVESGGNWVFQVKPESENELLQGEADLLSLPIAPGEQVRGEIGASITRQANGTFRVEVRLVSELRVPVEALRHGKLTKLLSGSSEIGVVPQGLLAGVPEHPTFQITGAQQGENDRLILLLRPANFSMVPAGDGNAAAQPMMVWQGDQRSLTLAGTCIIETPPDYSRILVQDEQLRKLAEKSGNEEAFGLVTGVPLKEEQAWGICGQQATNGRSGQAQNQSFCFRDEIPGIGSNRFFYRVRAVDAAENRSLWSDVSAPFYQVDTTPPEAPRDFQVFPGDRNAMLMWLPSQDPQITGYRVYRTEAGDSFNVLNSDAYAELELSDLQTKPLMVVGGSLALPKPLKFTLSSGLSVADIAAYINPHILVQELTATTNPANLFDPATSSAIFDTSDNGNGTLTVYVRSLSGLIQHAAGVALRVVADQTIIEGDPALRTWQDTGLEGGKPYTYHVTAVKTVRTASELHNQQFHELVIASPASVPVVIRGLDRSAPPAPAVIATDWIDVNGNVTTEAASDVRLRLTIQATPGADRVLVQRRGADDTPWITPAINGKRGWQDWPIGVEQVQLTDDTAKPHQVRIYRVQIRTADGRISEPANIQLSN